MRANSLIARYLSDRTPDNLSALQRFAEVLARSHRQGRKAPPGPRPKTGVFSDLETERAAVFSRHLARQAEADPDVQRIRDEFFRGGPLDAEQVERLLGSVAARFFPHDFFKDKGIPLLEHEASIVDLPETGKKKRKRKKKDPAERRQAIRIKWGNKRPFSKPFDCAVEAHIMERGTILAIHPKGSRVMPGSVLDEIREVAERLVGIYLWSQVAAQRFVLTGEIPQIHPIVLPPAHGSTRQFAHCPIVLRIQPWVSAGTVSRAYEMIHKKVYGSKRRPISLKNLALFEFVFENPPEGDRTWDDLRLEWNQKHRAWAFKNYRAMRQEFYRYRDVIRFAGDPLRRDRP
ncbi:MAG: hypothetical protein KAY32_12760 [Candidatus Eisenbacteria sp.]|nr:hypothetical protein [Candidatus Eisenbacteria bacterium]